MRRRGKDYTAFYHQITKRIRSDPQGPQAVRIADRILTAVMYAAYPILLILLAVKGYRGEEFSWSAAAPAALGAAGRAAGACRLMLPYILIPGISFVLVSVIRDRINWKRPYEDWPIEPLIHKDTKGHSMPSRHVFSAAVISMCWLSISTPAGVILLCMTVCSAAVRVLGGVHYPRDVAAGLLIGIAAGALLWIF